MNRFLRNWWKYAIAMIAVGAALFLFSVTLGARGGYAYIGDRGLQFAPSGGDATDVMEMDLAPFDSVDVSVDSADIEFVASDRYGLEMRLPEHLEKPEWGVSDGMLTVRAASRKYAFTFMNIGLTRHYVRIYYPAGGANAKAEADGGNAQFKSIDVKTSSGKIVVPKLSAEGINMNTGSGRIEADVRLYRQANAHTSSGSIIFNGGGNDGSLRLSADSGSVRADASGCSAVDIVSKSGAITVTGDTSDSTEMTIKTSSGKTDVNISEWRSLTADTASGSIAIRGRPSGATNAKTKSGSVTMTLRGDESDFSYILTANSGKVSVGGRNLGKTARRDNGGATNAIGASAFKIGRAHV
jgi:hypothetical protein